VDSIRDQATCAKETLRETIEGTKQGYRLTWEAETALTKRHIASARDDEVIEAFHIKEFSGLDDLPGNENVFWGWRRITCRVIMRNDDTRGVEA
jgi:hypothetical protein